jgi:phospholipase/carboxylesterase
VSGRGLVTRRRFAAVLGAAVGSLALGGGCRAAGDGSAPDNSGRLTVRPKSAGATATPGQAALGLGRSRDGVLQVPANATGALPLFVLLHGAGGSGQRMLQRIAPAVEEAGLVVLAPDSRGSTWDAIADEFGPDVAFMDRALDRVFSTVSIDPARVVLGGFSDGATYALSLGMINGDMFTKIVAFSPGFVVYGKANGRPRVFISHGTDDPILPIDHASRQIVPALRGRGYDVTYREFAGRHEVPPDIATEALTWAARAGTSQP